MKRVVVTIMVMLSSLISACAYVVPEKPPSIAHVHIGHALTAWTDTPGNQGLFVVTENEARRVLDLADSLTSQSTLDQIRSTMGEIVNVIEPPNSGRSRPDENYGLKRAFTGAMDHLEFAADSDDASANVRSTIPGLRNDAQAVVERHELIVAIAREIQDTTSVTEAAALTEEVQILARGILYGVELDGKDPIGSRPDEYGLLQLRNAIAAMTEREDPPYVPVSEKWLFGLVRLPSGEWRFDFGGPAGVGGARGGGY
jgi:hypothetical protein